MKRIIIISLTIFLVMLTGCNSQSTTDSNTSEISKDITSMEVLIDNQLVKITDNLTYSDLEKQGFTLDENYNGVLERTLKPSKNDSMIMESFNVKTAKNKLIAISVANTGNTECTVKEGTVCFIGTYSGEEYDHSYTLPSGIKHNDTSEKIIKAWGQPQVNLSHLESGKMLQYKTDKCTFTANLDDNGKMVTFSFMLN